MNGLEKLELLEDIDEEYIRSAENVRKKRPVWKSVLPIAAGFLLVIGAALLIGKSLIKPASPVIDAALPSALPTSDASETGAPVITDHTEPSALPAVTSDPEADRLYLVPVNNLNEAVGSDHPDELEWGIDYSMFI